VGRFSYYTAIFQYLRSIIYKHLGIAPDAFGVPPITITFTRYEKTEDGHIAEGNIYYLLSNTEKKFKIKIKEEISIEVVG